MAKQQEFPFIPKSTASIEPGHFWSIPLRHGGYACGRVIQLWLKDGKRDSQMFLAGLMDWSGDAAPTADAIAGCGVIEQGSVHIKTIRENRGEILGLLDLALDGIEPNLFKNAGHATFVQRGFEELRPFDPRLDAALPVFSTWGFRAIKMLAEVRCGKPRRDKKFT